MPLSHKVNKNKRGVEIIDLSQDDENAHRPTKISRNAKAPPLTNASSGQRFGQDTSFLPLSQSDSIRFSQLDDDDAAANDLIQSSQNLDDVDVTEYQLFDDMHTKIVGVRYYRGHATLGEHVVVAREPNNQYDPNAIRVLNVMGQQIGHIPRQIAAKLAKYMDERSLIIEGILTGVIGAYDCPMVLKLYGTGDPVRQEQLKKRMKADRLPLSKINALNLERKKQLIEAERARKRKEAERRAMALKGNGKSGPYAGSFGSLQTVDVADLEDLLDQSSSFDPRKMGQSAEKFGLKESDLANMPMVDTPPTMKTELLPYQRQGLAWMLEKEAPCLPTEESQNAVQLWKREGPRYRNVATNYAMSNEPPLASGGILADDMGLGKTIQIISLIMANSRPRSAQATTATLILSPVGVMSNWKGQIEAHVKAEHTPKILVYHGAGKKEAANLSQYDVVITSYGALVSEYTPNVKGPLSRAKGLYSVHWRRVVLDEGHTIRNPRSKGSLAACHLRADSRWTLTGTPIINSLKDLYSQVRFLRLSGGLDDLTMFNAVLIRPLNSGDPLGVSILQELMAAICLRRRKDMSFINLRLPPMKSHVLRIKFHSHEQEKYEMFQAEAKGMLDRYQTRDNETGGTGPTYTHLLEILLRMRQVCNHWALCKNRVDKLMSLLDQNKVIELTPENIKALQEILQLRIESQETCAVCLDNLEEPVITACGHAFDKSCIEQVIERQHKCPLCRADIKDTNNLVSPATELGEDTAVVEVDPNASSSKVDALLKILTAKGQAEGTKTVVFSQWTSFLHVIEPHLQHHGINFTRIDGKLNSTKRDQAINEFTNNPECTVLLASLNVCSVGLNLVAGNQVILCDSWWAPAIEDQAVDRVYRLGQTRDTTVWRLVMEGSIEDRVLAIQENKRLLSMTALSETENNKRKTKAKSANLADIEKLLG
ncbi:putative SNF2 family helicase [Talaromyces proteolyticus]|uniref:SNF2 family helicase n=1 Tax=Talaromyces proteolyticus TaxID=1131652 RepID=A0AAD4KYC9_9EURO|nr:putative SNF2 family helicase [Talaromyces proteolyticus]KAH8702541.1 putative SNF2 family helicase [Talaromyces proteolyticus]